MMQETLIDKDKVLKRLLSIWEAHVPHREEISFVKNNRARVLLSIFNKYFSNSFSRWRGFVLCVARSDLLFKPKKGFKFSFDWAIQSENIERILRGIYSSKSIEEFNRSLMRLESKAVHPLWKKALKDIAYQMGKDAYRGFSSRLKFLRERDGVLTFKSCSKFKELYRQSCYYKRRFSEILQKHFKDVKKINLVSKETEEIGN